MGRVIRNKVIVVGISHTNALGIIRSLGEFGCEVYFITLSNTKSFVTKSRYLSKFWHARDGQHIIDLILNEFKDEVEKPIIIPADDTSASIIDRNINLLADNFLFQNIRNEQSAIFNNMNKTQMNKLAEKFGFLVPKSFLLDFSELMNIDVIVKKVDITYPCIVKPVQSIEGSKSDIAICKNAEVLDRVLKRLKSSYARVLVQQFIEKDGEFGIQGFATNEGSEVFIPGVIIKLRQSKVSQGSTTYAKIVKDHPLIEMERIAALINDLRYSGIFDIELIYSGNKVYFIEMNFRNGAYGYAFTKAGVNIPALWCLSAIGIDISNAPTKVSHEIFLMNETADFRCVLAKQIGLLSWIMQFLKADVHLLCNKNDLRPFIYKLIRR